MGTRNLTCVVVDGEYKVAQYGQWDGYPDGQGVTVLDFLQTVDMGEFKDRLAHVTQVTDKEIGDVWVECGAERGVPFVSIEVSKKVKAKYPQFSRDTAAEVLPLIMNSEGEFKLQGDIGFATQSLFCEWCYVVDMDKNTFEVYNGCNKSPIPKGERFYSEDAVVDEDGYYPVRLRATFDLDKLPTKEKFLATFKEDDGEGESMGASYANAESMIVKDTP